MCQKSLCFLHSDCAEKAFVAKWELRRKMNFLRESLYYLVTLTPGTLYYSWHSLNKPFLHSEPFSLRRKGFLPVQVDLYKIISNLLIHWKRRNF